MTNMSTPPRSPMAGQPPADTQDNIQAEVVQLTGAETGAQGQKDEADDTDAPQDDATDAPQNNATDAPRDDAAAAAAAAPEAIGEPAAAAAAPEAIGEPAPPADDNTGSHENVEDPSGDVAPVDAADGTDTRQPSHNAASQSNADADDSLDPDASIASSVATETDTPARKGTRTPAQIEASAFLAWVKAVREAQGSTDSDADATTSSSSNTSSAMTTSMSSMSLAASLPLETVQDLADGNALLSVLVPVDPSHFRNPHAHADSKDNYVLRLGTLKRLYKLMMQYYAETLLLTPSSIPQPDLGEIARTSSAEEICKLCKLAIGIAIQSDRTKTLHISAIQTLSTEDQQSLMVSIEGVMSGLKSVDPSERAGGQQQEQQQEEEETQAQRDSRFAMGKVKAEKAELEKLYLSLVEQHQNLQTTHEDALAEKDELSKDLERAYEERERRKHSGADVVLRGEIDVLKGQLRKSEDHLAEAESEVERLSNLEMELNRKLSDLQGKADEGIKLKDQLDEYRHIADKAQRTENAMEKYKKKLEEMGGVRRQLKDLEEQNSELIDRNASLEREYAKLADFKPLMENYKGQIDDLNAKNARQVEELTAAKYNLEQTTLQLRALEEARNKDAEELQLYQERVEELELGLGGSGGASSKRRKPRTSAANNGAEGLAANDAPLDDDEDEDNGDDILVDDELEDALQGTTMTDLKLRVHQLSRELKAAKRNKADTSRIVVLENLLEDSQRLKKKYQEDHLKEYTERLKLAGEMDKIRSGSSSLGDGTEAAYALRLRLNEVLPELDALKKQHAEVLVKLESTERDLTVAQSDLNLVNKDQTDILSTLRSEVNKEKASLEGTVASLKMDLSAAQDESSKLSAQIQTLLMDKIQLMEGGWSEREAALQREREMGELRSSLAGKKLPPEAEEMLVRLTSQNKEMGGKLEASEDKMRKAKAFIRQQDKLLQEAKKSGGGGGGGGGGKAEEELRKELANLKKEQRLVLSAFHHLASTRTQQSLLAAGAGGGAGARGSAQGSGGGGGGSGAANGLGSAAAGGGRAQPRSWLGQQQRGRSGMSWVLGRS